MRVEHLGPLHETAQSPRADEEGAETGWTRPHRSGVAVPSVRRILRRPPARRSTAYPRDHL